MIVFLDSNIYIGAKYRVDSGRFKSLRLLLEFKDAIIIHALREYSKTVDDEIVVIHLQNLKL